MQRTSENSSTTSGFNFLPIFTPDTLKIWNTIVWSVWLEGGGWWINKHSKSQHAKEIEFLLWDWLRGTISCMPCPNSDLSWSPHTILVSVSSILQLICLSEPALFCQHLPEFILVQTGWIWANLAVHQYIEQHWWHCRALWQSGYMSDVCVLRWNATSIDTQHVAYTVVGIF